MAHFTLQVTTRSAKYPQLVYERINMMREGCGRMRGNIYISLLGEVSTIASKREKSKHGRIQVPFYDAFYSLAVDPYDGALYMSNGDWGIYDWGPTTIRKIHNGTSLLCTP